LVKHLAVLLFALLIGALQLRAQAVSCESSPAAANATWTLSEKLETASFAQSIVLREQAYRQMSQLDPRDFRPLRRYLQSVHYDTPEKWDTIREQALADVAAHPNDPVRLSAAALLLTGKDTPRAFRLMDQVLAANPNYAPAYAELAGMYKNLGKFEDKEKSASELAKFYELCPSSSDSHALSLLKVLGSKALKEQVAQNLRRRLATSIDPHFLQTYSDVWAIEFSTLATNEYAKERQRVTEDLKRVEQLPVETTSNWLGFLRDGYKQSSVADAQVDALESRILKDFPHSNEAFGIKYEKWKDQHPEPAGEAAVAEWQQYMRLAVSHYRELISTFPQEHGFGYSLVEYSANLDGTSNEEIVHNGEDFIKDTDLL
jgi:tetratricopeptide (TPR) repeat protein